MTMAVSKGLTATTSLAGIAQRHRLSDQTCFQELCPSDILSTLSTRKGGWKIRPLQDLFLFLVLTNKPCANTCFSLLSQ